MAGGAAGAIMTGTATAAKNDEHDAQPDTDNSNAQKLPDVDRTAMEVGTGVLGVACVLGAVGMGLFGRSINKHDNVNVRNRHHSKVFSKMELKDNQILISKCNAASPAQGVVARISIERAGKIDIDNTGGKEQIKISSNDNIVLSSAKEVRVLATKVAASKGIFLTRNIKDLG
jgi:hypothetical protein